jgi:DNA ligase (NAD+)
MSNKKGIEEKIKDLTLKINYHNDCYYVYDNPEITDEEYDALKRELEKLEKEFPHFKLPNSPTDKVGALAQSSFEKVEHKIPMLSLSNAFNAEELRAFDKRLKRKLNSDDTIEYICELKFDGLAVSVHYMDGELFRASTRGDGHIGEDITENIKMVSHIPLQLNEPAPPEIEFRGEVFMPIAEFEKLNEKRKQNKEKLFANPRNAASGSLRQQDVNVTKQRGLDLFIYDIGVTNGLKPFATHKQKLKLAKLLGMNVNEYCEIFCDSIEEVIEFCKSWIEKRDTLPYAVDGVVIKANNVACQENAGSSSHSPRWAVAYKFPAEEVETVVKDIVVQVGRTGALTPVAVMDPVMVDGSMVQNATLHNEDELRRKDVRIGDRVVIRKAGDVIPEIVSVVKEARTGSEKEFVMPTKCPQCGGEVVRKDEEAVMRCINLNCPAQKLRALQHWVSKDAMDIDGLGSSVAEQLFESNLVEHPLDLYKLSKEDFLQLDRMGEKSAQNLIDSINISKNRDLSRLIYALGIMHVGKGTAKRLVKKYSTLEELANASQIELEAIEDIGEITAKSIYDFFNAPYNENLLQKMYNLNINTEVQKESIKDDRLNGLKFIFTGKLEKMTRSKIKKLTEALGGEVSSSISKSVDYLVVGENPGSKLQKAKKADVSVITEKEFYKMLKERT